jgi:hypothetical protein
VIAQAGGLRPGHPRSGSEVGDGLDGDATRRRTGPLARRKRRTNFQPKHVRGSRAVLWAAPQRATFRLPTVAFGEQRKCVALCQRLAATLLTQLRHRQGIECANFEPLRLQSLGRGQ